MKVLAFVVAGAILLAYGDEGMAILLVGLLLYLLVRLAALDKRVAELERQLRDPTARRMSGKHSAQETNASSEVSSTPAPEPVSAKVPTDPSTSPVSEASSPPTFAVEFEKEPMTPIDKPAAQPARIPEKSEGLAPTEPKPTAAVDTKATVKTAAAKVKVAPPKSPLKSPPRPPAKPSAFEQALDRGLQKIKDLVVGYFTGGNSLVRTGMLVLFVGVAFLLKYVAERTVVPVEVRYIGVLLAALVMLILGWRLRPKRPGYALSLQGGGIGLLYLTLFAALRIHQLLPPSVVLLCLIGIVVLASALAVLQNAMALAVIGVIGGFAAPILTSTGSGSHVQLFAYYLLLNLGILGMAWFRSWRLLNVLGFVATFAVGSLWGLQYYQPAYFATVEPFLIAHFLLYVLIAVLFAFKQPPKLRGINDGTLIFGTPIVVFALQAGLVKDWTYGLAYSALVLGVFYVLLAWLIKLMHRPFFKDLVESFVALGIGFATLAIPLGFDGRVTSAMWVAEASALLWVGVRQSRLLPRLSAYALTAMGCVAFFLEPPGSGDLLPFLNADFVGVLMVVAASAFMGWYVRAQGQRLWSAEATWIPRLMWLNTVLWWLGGSLVELHRHFPEQVYLLQSLWLVVTVVWLLVVAQRLADGLLVAYALIIQCLMLPLLLLTPTGALSEPLINVRFLGLMVVAVFYLAMSLFWRQLDWPKSPASLAQGINHRLLSRFVLAVGVVLWLLGLTIEIQQWYAFGQLLWMMLMMAGSAALLWGVGRRLSQTDFIWAAVSVVLAMVLPLYFSLLAGEWFVPSRVDDPLPVFNVTGLSLLIYFLAHFSFSHHWQKHRYAEQAFNDQVISRVLLGLAMGAWAMAGWLEIEAFFALPQLMSVLVAFVALSVVLFVWLAHRLQWSDLHRIKYALTPLLMYMALVTTALQDFHAGYGWAAWLLAFAVNYWLLRVYEGASFKWAAGYHVASLWLLAMVLMLDAVSWVGDWLGQNNIWYHATAPAVLLLLCGAVMALKHRLHWPLVVQQMAYFSRAIPVMLWLLWGLVVWMNLREPGALLGVPYWPLLNAMDLVALMAMALAVVRHRQDEMAFLMPSMKAKYVVAASTGFLLLNATMLRCFHYWYGIEYRWSDMLNSYLVQTGFSVLWATTALALMVLATQRHWRQVWLVGLGLMVVVVIKLFTVDMSASGSIERIVAFLSVGFLISVVGYFSPIPPGSAKPDEPKSTPAETPSEK
ncbi:DUF2339 domain-containing protein [Marinicella meishanensis]|uniref:DUF2339 domain-containing protein n=1 Tax=Marinicella meishanensis TaxID=2873263 RepID=UPI001CC16792|nr:DUF2339 domain-containing protein [Marinicella sp. NBU2979]